MKAGKNQHWEVIVLGGGAAGIAAATAAARNGARVLLIDAGPMIGGELVSGIPVDGCLNTRGEWIVGGVVDELFAECKRMEGYIGPLFDWRTIWVVCVDPEVMKLAVSNLVSRAGVQLLLYSFATEIVLEAGRIAGIVVVNKEGRRLFTADVFIDCSGDGDLAVMAGARYENGDQNGALQPVSLVFRMQGVEARELLEWAREHPDDIAVAENPWIQASKAECLDAIARRGVPKLFIKGNGPTVSAAVARGEMYATSLIASNPTSLHRREVSLNTTRCPGVNATHTGELSKALPSLIDQVWQCVQFMQRNIPGYRDARFSGLAPRIGIRETRRVIGEEVLGYEDVRNAVKRDDVVCKGAHHIDIHGAGAHQRREPIKDGGSFDVPLGCLIPRHVKNLLMAGRCFSASREAHGAARVMGTCLAMGQAVGTAAAIVAAQKKDDVRQIDIGELQRRLRAQGAILEGTH
jgi:hypothetical protein